MTKELRNLLQRKEKAAAKARTALDAAKAENRIELNADEQSTYDAAMADITQLNAAITREEMVEEAMRGSASFPDGPITGGVPRIEHDPKRGFTNFGEFAAAVAAVPTKHQMDERLKIGAAAPSTYSNEGSGADGGFLVPAEFGQGIWSLSLEQDAFLPLTDQMPVSGNSMTFPSDETTPWGTDGVRAYWEGEAEAATATKPKLNPNTMRLKKLMALVPVTDELLADAPSISAYLMSKVGESIRWKTNDAIINGNGVGKPLGIANAGSIVSQAKEASQTADTINEKNIVKMFSRLTRPGNGVWLVNPDAYPQLPLMSIGNQPVFIGPTGLVGAPGGTLQGRPVILTDTCQKLGDLGDIYFVDFGMYRTLTKASGVEVATSMHLYFDAGATAFRAVFRIDGQPIMKSAVTPPNSTVTRSGYVSLAERA